MKKSELTFRQKLNLSVFNLIFEQNQWLDYLFTEKRLDVGEELFPEGARYACFSNIELTAEFHAPYHTICLKIVDHENFLATTLYFILNENPNKVLEWIVKVGPKINFANYSVLIKELYGECEEVIFDFGEGTFGSKKMSVKSLSKGYNRIQTQSKN